LFRDGFSGRENSEAFLEGHNQAFAYFGGVPRTMLYDNTRIAVKEVIKRSLGMANENLRKALQWIAIALSVRGQVRNVRQGQRQREAWKRLSGLWRRRNFLVAGAAGD